MTPSSNPILLFLVALIAFLYSSIGIGGSTGYLAVMSFFEIEPNLMATTALLLNVVVAGIAFFNYAHAGYVEKRLLFLFPLTSIPAAFVGGYFRLNSDVYFALLYIILTYVSIRMLFASEKTKNSRPSQTPPIWQALLLGTAIGLLSGMVGMGGGIILSPMIILMNWATTKQAASTAAGFVFVNSLSGLLGRYFGGNFVFGNIGVILLPIGIISALIGSYFGARKFSNVWVQRVLGVVLLIAVIKFWAEYF